MLADSRQGKIARALCLMGPGRHTRAQVMRKADDKLYDGDVFYIARAFFPRADLVGLAVEEDGESLLVREATAAEKDNAIRFSAYLTGRPDRRGPAPQSDGRDECLRASSAAHAIGAREGQRTARNRPRYWGLE